MLYKKAWACGHSQSESEPCVDCIGVVRCWKDEINTKTGSPDIWLLLCIYHRKLLHNILVLESGFPATKRRTTFKIKDNFKPQFNTRNQEEEDDPNANHASGLKFSYKPDYEDPSAWMQQFITFASFHKWKAKRKHKLAACCYKDPQNFGLTALNMEQGLVSISWKGKKFLRHMGQDQLFAMSLAYKMSDAS